MSKRFGFGKNWGKFLSTLDEQRIDEAKKSLADWLGEDDLTGKTFLDIGSGSGLFSLAARMMGAKVKSFDYDTDSVECTRTLKDRYYKDDADWDVEQGDALDEEYLSKYGKVDIVYSWGVLHHTGNMYKALKNAGNHVLDGGKLFIAIYNDQGFLSKFWIFEKKIYNSVFLPIKLLIVMVFFVLLWTLRFIKDILRLKPLKSWFDYKKKRGMSPWHDAVDWCGGFPFEVAKPEEIIDFYLKRGFELVKLKTCGGGNACNQFVFVKKK